jgi:hypothetical protein
MLEVANEFAIVEGRQESLKRCAFTTSRDVRMPAEGEFFVGRDGKQARDETGKRRKTNGGGVKNLVRRWWPRRWLRRKTR